MGTEAYDLSRVQPRFSDSLWALVTAEGKPVQFRRGEFLYWQNSPSPGIYCVESGHVKVFQILDNGMESILYNVASKSMLGEVSTFNGAVSSPAAIAQTAVSAYLLSPGKTRELIASDGEFALFVVDSLVHKLRVLSDQFGVVSGKKVLCRLAAILSTLDYYGVPRNEDRWFSITQAELAGLISTTRPNTTALLNRLADQGLIELRRNMVRVLDREGLESLSMLEE